MNESTPIIAAYYPEWGIYERDHLVSDVQADKITHLIYAFTKIQEDFTVGLFDQWAATDIAFSAADSVDGVADFAGQEIMGNFNQLAELKDAHPHLSVMVAIGGWTLSDNFSDMAATAEGRATFADSVVAFLQQYSMFDGVDLDWEYPGGGGLPGNSVREEDGTNYALLVAELRDKLDALETETGRSYEISAAVPGGYDKIENLDIPGLAENLDFMNLMTYDFYGAWQNTTGHLAGLFDPTGAQYDVTTAVDLYLEAGVDPSKLVLGLPSYARAWQGVNVDDPSEAWNSSSGGGAPGTYPGVEPAYYEYKDLLSRLQQQDSDWGLYYDDNAQAAFLYNPTLGIFSSFETPSTIALKSEWAQSLGLGGVMFWDTSGDSNTSESLITAAYESWFEGLTFYEIDENSSLEFDAIYGGDGIFKPIAESDTPPVEDLPQLSVNNRGAEEGEGAALRFRVDLSEASDEEVSVSYYTQQSTAKAGSDYIAESGILTFASGQTSAFVEVDIVDDDITEERERVLFKLEDAEGAEIFDAVASGWIHDDDEGASGLPSLSVNNRGVEEGEDAAFRFRVDLSEASEEEVSVSYYTQQSTAKAGSDYITESGVLTFAPGETQAFVEVDVVNDNIAEEQERVLFKLENAEGAEIFDAVASGWINDDDEGDNGGEDPLPPIGDEDYSVELDLINDWGSGAQLGVTLTNTSGSTAESWAIGIDLPFEVGDVWDAEIAEVSGNRYLFDEAPWNGTLQSGQSVSFGFVANEGNINLPSLLDEAEIGVFFG